MPLDLTRDLKIGTSGYSYSGRPPKGWYGAFYPEKKPKGFDELRYYSQIFNTCEINNTFYRPPSQAVARGWVEKTPVDFSFCVKLWQKFTHPIKISRKKSEEQWEPPNQADFDEFRAGILPLAEAGKLGALLVQYPVGFHWSAENMEKVARTLQWFYDYPKVVELRHRSWGEQSGEVKALLQEHRASGVLIDEPKFATSIRQELEPTGAIFYFRAHGRNAKAWWNSKESWERYDYLYSREEIKKHAERIKTAASAPGVQKAFAFYNNHSRANAPANAIMLAQELGVRLRAMPSEAMLKAFPELLQRSAGKDPQEIPQARTPE
ncbi:MAG TPA: DUF72 domain-containing protein [Candidatus Eisenbacteria bacterium]|nr:DUF72 domain-containing protein [Candidatus Eisenbacteria bacterium]